MRPSLLNLCLLIALANTMILADDIVTPNIYANTEGPGAINLLPGDPFGMKQLWVIDSSQFSSVSGSTQISEIDMRPNCDAASCSFPGAPFGPTMIQGLQITLGVTTHAPTDVSTDHAFADYLSNSLTVFSGTATISSSDIGPAAGPKAFDMTFPFSTPFTYDPSLGNLVVLFAVDSGDGIPTFIDGLQDGTGNFGRLFADTFTDQNGLGDSFNPVLQFTTGQAVTGVPEPGTLTLTILTFGLLGFVRLHQSFSENRRRQG
jgi:hypothetical protein